MKEKGRRLAHKIKEVTNEIFAALDGNFSPPYDLNARAKRRREKEMIPVR
jgi:hypothetical protein